MTVKSERQAGTEWVEGDVLEAVDLNDTFNITLIKVGEDLTMGEVVSSTAETEIAEVLIPANTVKTGVIIMAAGFVRVGASALNEGTIKLRTGTNSSGPSNTERLSINRAAIGVSSKPGWAISWVLTTEETWTSNVYIHITGQNNDNHAASGTGCENLVVIGW